MYPVSFAPCGGRARVVTARRHLPLDRPGVEIVGRERRVRRLDDRAVHAVTGVDPHFGTLTPGGISRADHAACAARRHRPPSRRSTGRDDRAARYRHRPGTGATTAPRRAASGCPRNATSAASSRLGQFVEPAASPGRAAGDDFAQRLRSHSRRDVDERRIISGSSQVGAMARLALLLVQACVPAQSPRHRLRAAASGRRRLGAQLVDRRHVDAQHVDDALLRDRRPCIPSSRRPAHRESTRCPSAHGGVNSPSLRAFAIRVFHSSRSSGVRMYGLMSSTVNVCGANGGGAVGNGCVGHARSPGMSLGGTGRSSMGHTGSPVTRSNT